MAPLPDTAEGVPHRDAFAVLAAGQVPRFHRCNGGPERGAFASPRNSRTVKVRPCCTAWGHFHSGPNRCRSGFHRHRKPKDGPRIYLLLFRAGAGRANRARPLRRKGPARAALLTQSVPGHAAHGAGLKQTCPPLSRLDGCGQRSGKVRALLHKGLPQTQRRRFSQRAICSTSGPMLPSPSAYPGYWLPRAALRSPLGVKAASCKPSASAAAQVSWSTIPVTGRFSSACRSGSHHRLRGIMVGQRQALDAVKIVANALQKHRVDSTDGPSLPSCRGHRARADAQTRSPARTGAAERLACTANPR